MESIKRARKRRGLSLTDVSSRTGLYREVIARAERAGTDVRGKTLGDRQGAGRPRVRAVRGDRP
jgi:transcriptional regulator with XRE-family HTH domain